MRPQVTNHDAHQLGNHAAQSVSVSPASDSYACPLLIEQLSNPKTWADWKAKLPVFINARPMPDRV